ncbi:MAG: DUF1540 domain-containing protein [Clostridia bacterium]|nr:DUF1540 domain-containing protein [Clostridia bacterium]MBQ7048174.1 DUF1540 domain-containing protein [Clostridia bacterium]
MICDKKDSHKPIKGVNCAVKNCQYHDGETNCTAGCVAVGPSNACCSSETVCATFRVKEC